MGCRRPKAVGALPGPDQEEVKSAKGLPGTLASALKILINRASVDPGRELNGRSQQFHLFGDVDVAGPVGPSSRVPAF